MPAEISALILDERLDSNEVDLAFPEKLPQCELPLQVHEIPLSKEPIRSGIDHTRALPARLGEVDRSLAGA